MTNAARDFIENELLTFVHQVNAWKQVPAFIERNRHLWDKPDHISESGKKVSLVDEDAFNHALYAARGEGWASDRARFTEFLQAYEQAKLDKANKGITPTITPLMEKLMKAKPVDELDKAFRDIYAEAGITAFDFPRKVDELPPLPSRFGYQIGDKVFCDDSVMESINALITWAQSVNKRIV